MNREKQAGLQFSIGTPAKQHWGFCFTRHLYVREIFIAHVSIVRIVDRPPFLNVGAEPTEVLGRWLADTLHVVTQPLRWLGIVSLLPPSECILREDQRIVLGDAKKLVDIVR